MSVDPEHLRIVEALLFASREPIDAVVLAMRLLFWANSRPSMRRAASISSGSPANGCFERPRISPRS